MKFQTPILAAGALAATLALGSAFSAPAEAEPLPKLNDMFVLDQDAFTTFVVIDAPMELQDEPCFLMRGDLPFQGDLVGGTILNEGMNLAMIPNGPGDWLTAFGAFKPRSGQSGDIPFEE